MQIFSNRRRGQHLVRISTENASRSEDEMEQQNLLDERNLGIKIPWLSFRSPLFPRFLAIILLEDTWTGTSHGIGRIFWTGTKGACDWQRSPLAMYESEEGRGENKVVRLTVDKKQFARRGNNRGMLEFITLVSESCSEKLWKMFGWNGIK